MLTTDRGAVTLLTLSWSDTHLPEQTDQLQLVSMRANKLVLGLP